jgi:PAS domain S-box-containing protein
VDYVNHAYLSFTGRCLQDELGDGWLDLLHPDDRERCLDVRHGAFLRRESFRTEYRLRHASGEFRWLLDAGEPVYGLEGEFLGYIGSCYDIDDRKKTEELLRDSQAELRADLETLTHIAEERRQAIARVVEEDDRRAGPLADQIENDQLQALAALNIRVALLRERLAEDEVAETLDPVTRSVQETIARMRRLMEELRDPEARLSPP